jgi:acyl carrier protein
MTNAMTAVMAAVCETTGRQADQISLADRLKEDLGVDSSDFVRLIQNLEDLTRSKISDEAAASAATVGDLVRLSEGLPCEEA